MPRPGSSLSVTVPSRDIGDRTAEPVAQRIVVGIDLEQSVAADAGQQMRRRQQADAAAEIMRAEYLAGLRISRAISAQTLRPPHLAISGCTTLQHIVARAPARNLRGSRCSRRPPAAHRLPRASACHSCHGRSARIGSSSQARSNSPRCGASCRAPAPSTRPDWHRRPACRRRPVARSDARLARSAASRSRSSTSARDVPVRSAASAICREPVGLMPLA